MSRNTPYLISTVELASRHIDGSRIAPILRGKMNKQDVKRFTSNTPITATKNHNGNLILPVYFIRSIKTNRVAHDMVDVSVSILTGLDRQRDEKVAMLTTPIAKPLVLRLPKTSIATLQILNLATDGARIDITQESGEEGDRALFTVQFPDSRATELWDQVTSDLVEIIEEEIAWSESTADHRGLPPYIAELQGDLYHTIQQSVMGDSRAALAKFIEKYAGDFPYRNDEGEMSPPRTMKQRDRYKKLATMVESVYLSLLNYYKHLHPTTASTTEEHDTPLSGDDEAFRRTFEEIISFNMGDMQEDGKKTLSATPQPTTDPNTDDDEDDDGDDSETQPLTAWEKGEKELFTQGTPFQFIALTEHLTNIGREDLTQYIYYNIPSDPALQRHLKENAPDGLELSTLYVQLVQITGLMAQLLETRPNATEETARINLRRVALILVATTVRGEAGRVGWNYFAHLESLTQGNYNDIAQDLALPIVATEDSDEVPQKINYGILNTFTAYVCNEIHMSNLDRATIANIGRYCDPNESPMDLQYFLLDVTDFIDEEINGHGSDVEDEYDEDEYDEDEYDEDEGEDEQDFEGVAINGTTLTSLMKKYGPEKLAKYSAQTLVLLSRMSAEETMNSEDEHLNTTARRAYLMEALDSMAENLDEVFHIYG